MDKLERLLIVRDIEELMVDFWHDVDLNWGADAHNYFTEDGTYTTSLKARTGRNAIRDFYDKREARGARVSRHVITNHRITVHDRAHVTAVSILHLFAADGEPVLPSKPAIMIADVIDEIVRESDGRWRYKSRTLKPLFRDDTPTTG